METFLSKSDFLSGRRCKKLLYYLYNPPSMMKDIPFKYNLAESNKNITIQFGQQLYKGGIDLSRAGTINGLELVDATHKALTGQHQIFYNGAFYSNGLLTKTDIMVLSERNNRILEIQNATRLKLPQDIYDMGFLWKVLSTTGMLKNLKLFIVHLNKEYRRGDKIDIESLFVHEDVTMRARQIQTLIETELNDLSAVLARTNPPDVKVGMQCIKPSACQFSRLCWNTTPKNSLSSVSSLTIKQKEFLKRQGIDTLLEIPRGLKVSEIQRVELNSVIGKKPYINDKAIGEIIKPVVKSNSIQILNIEVDRFPIPQFPGFNPYEYAPFQFCLLNTQPTKAIAFERKEFIAPTNGDPRELFLVRLLQDTESNSPIIIYDDEFTLSMFEHLAVDFPAFAQEIKNRINRITDLKYLFKNKYYWRPEFKGRVDFETIFQILCPGQAELISTFKNFNHISSYRQLPMIDQAGQISLLKELRDNSYKKTIALYYLFEEIKSLK